MRKITFLFIALLITNFSFSQCINGTEYDGTPPISNEDGEIQAIAFGIFAGEFVTISGLDSADDYQFTSNRTAT